MSRVEAYMHVLRNRILNTGKYQVDEVRAMDIDQLETTLHSLKLNTYISEKEYEMYEMEKLKNK